MSAIKQKRAANQLQMALAVLVRDELDDPRLQDLTITEVRLDRELEHATIFVAALAGDEARDSVLAGLNSARGFLRRELSRRLHVRRAPELHFHWDAGLERGERIGALLDGLQPGPAQAGPPAAPADEADADAAGEDGQDGLEPDGAYGDGEPAGE
jgi:ribosome-binding factor A